MASSELSERADSYDSIRRASNDIALKWIALSQTLPELRRNAGSKNTTQLLKHAQACRAKKCSQLRNKSTSKRQRVVSQKEREDVEKAAMLGDR